MTTHFLKQLTEDTIKHKRLLIPGEFVRRCGRGNMTNPVVLEPIVGDAREMELYEDGGGFWLRNGWEELVDHYKLRHGYYLLFEYKSYSRFKLLMLDGNGLDLEFPCSSSPPNVGSNENQEYPEHFQEQESVDAHSVEIIGSSFKEMNNNNGSCGRQPAQPLSAENNGKEKELISDRKKRTADSTKKMKRTADDGEEREVNREAPRRDRANGRSPFGRDKDQNSRIPSMPEQEGISMMKDTNINNNNGDGGGRQQAQQWSAENATHKEFMRRKRRTTQGGQEMRVNREATRRNGGDGSPFGRDKVGNSHIPSMEEEPSFSKRPSSSKCGRPTTTSEAVDEQPEFLQVTIPKSSFETPGLGIQREFIQRHITNWSGKVVELQVGEEKWPVKISQTALGYPRLSQGWLAFARENFLKASDTCIFVPTTTSDLLRVHILRSRKIAAR